jgi:hypothetical protein
MGTILTNSSSVLMEAEGNIGFGEVGELVFGDVKSWYGKRLGAKSKKTNSKSFNFYAPLVYAELQRLGPGLPMNLL